ncbi:KDEL motif-containing protein 1 [Seminavis robusta]|uniref:KDEL motif-containing protein 1 n=1 Tax=Seminavis robusta TaxID=568900 RepID=A0A9N8DJG4_9STRA|nr:KDEL motif-containing protein 1 [Seminavis robusta]|eukprot:Sro177_g077670.1 KDEL motif-containing protein 1 (475) ;mRNA; r:24211-25719
MAVISSSSRPVRIPLRSRNRGHGFPWISLAGRWLGYAVLICVVISLCYPTETYDTYMTVSDEVSFRLQGYTEAYSETTDWSFFQNDFKHRFGRLPPASLQQWHRYARYHGCLEMDGYQTLHDDLEPYRRQKRQKHRRYYYEKVISSGIHQTDNYMVFQVKNHILTVIAQKCAFDEASIAVIEKNFRWMLTPVVQHTPPLDAIFFFDLHDNPTRKSNPDSLPIFGTCRMTYWTDDQPTTTITTDEYSKATQLRQPFHPDFMDTSYESSSVLLVPYYWALDVSLFSSSGPAFTQRQDAIVWRGVTTGQEWGVSPRFQLVDEYGQKKESGVQLDFGFTGVVQNTSAAHTLPPGTTLAPHMNDAQTQQYKYIMDVDGNAFTSRFPRLLQSGSLLFKSTRFREWYTERLQPYKHYVPVNYNLSDLVEKLTWAHEHPQMAPRIVQNADTASKQFFRRKEMQCYVYRMMLEYNDLFEPTTK